MTTREHDDLLQTHHLRIEEEEKVGGREAGLGNAKMCKQQTKITNESIKRNVVKMNSQLDMYV